jgi:Uma2 family endonuclease
VTAFSGQPYEPLSSELRILCSTGLYTYPDLSVVCGEFQFDDAIQDTILNPTMIVEVLSPSTRRYDREEKFHNYRSIQSLREYVLISQDHCYIEIFTRMSPLTVWQWNACYELSETLQLATGNCSIPVAAIDRQVTFESASEPTDESQPS